MLFKIDTEESKNNIKNAPASEIALMDKILENFGISDRNGALQIKEKLSSKEEFENWVLAVRGNLFKELMKDWFISETLGDMEFKSMFYSRGKAVFILNNYPMVGNWKQADDNTFYLITWAAKGLELRQPGTFSKYTKDAVKPNFYNGTTSGSYLKATAKNSFLLKKDDKTQEQTFNRLYDFEGFWIEENSKSYLSITKEDNNAEIILVKASNNPAGPWENVIPYYQKTGETNQYTDQATGNYLVLRSDFSCQMVPFGIEDPKNYYKAG